MRILLAIDASEASEAVLEEVAARPWPAGASIQVVNAVELAHPYVLGAPVVEVVQENAKLLTGRAADRLRSAGMEAEGVVLQGDPRTAIVDHAGLWRADLIIVGAHGAGALERFLLGSVSRAVLRHAGCSVEVVRAPVPAGAGYRVLLAVDGSEGSARAAKAIASLPWPPETEVRVLSAVELQLGFFRAAFEIPALDPSHLEPQREQAMQRSQQAVRGALEVLEEAGLKTSESISVLSEPPKQIIVEEAAEWNAGLIVLGSHGRRGVDRLLLGSTSEAVAAHAGCSVRVVR
ncbi:MAG: universal stress protein [Bryobacteraceae bacterium]|nr:universal stress protein [Bryobacteraceae bacterium]